MYTILITMVIFCLCYFIIPRAEYEDSGTAEGQVLRGFGWGRMAVLAILGAIVGWLIAALFMPRFVPGVTFRSEPSTLVSLRSVDGTSGAFVWANGSFGGSMRYNFYVRNANGSVSPWAINADNSVQLIEDPTLKDSGTWVTTFHDYDFSSPMVRWTVDLEGNRQIVGQELRVPAGTISTNFKVQ